MQEEDIDLTDDPLPTKPNNKQSLRTQMQTRNEEEER